MKNLSLVGRGYHTDEKVVGFYTAGDRVKFWALAAPSGRLLGPVLCSIFMTIPLSGTSSCLAIWRPC